MFAATYVSFALATLAVVLLAWRIRAAAVAALEREKVDARRGRQVQALAADVANLTQALVLSIDSIDEAPLDEESKEALAEANASLVALAETVRATQSLVQGAPLDVHSRAEGWIRVAVASARGDGVGVRIVGLGTELRARGRSDDLAGLLDDLIAGLGATLPPSGFVHVGLLRDVVEMSAPVAPGRFVDTRVQSAIARAGRVGWRTELLRAGDIVTVRLAPADEDEVEGEVAAAPLVGIPRRLDV